VKVVTGVAEYCLKFRALGILPRAGA